VAGQFVGFGDKLGDRRDELAHLLDRERVIVMRLVNHDVAGDAAVVVLRAADIDLDVDVGVVVRAVDGAPGALEVAERYVGFRGRSSRRRARRRRALRSSEAGWWRRFGREIVEDLWEGSERTLR
jgi:hypothetical protein